METLQFCSQYFSNPHRTAKDGSLSTQFHCGPTFSKDFSEATKLAVIDTWFIKSAALGDHLNGSSSIFISTCLVRMCYRIYFLFLPLYGLRPSMNSYPMTPTAK